MKNVIVYLFVFTWPHPVYASIGAHSFLGKMRECVLDFFVSGTRNMFVIIVQHTDFLASKIVFILWYPFQKQQPEGTEGF